MERKTGIPNLGSGVPATVLSIIFFGFGATGFFTQLQSALNAIWQVAPKPGRGLRGVLRDRLESFLTVLGTSTLLLAALSALGRILPDSLALEGVPFWRGMTFVVSWAVLTLAIVLIGAMFTRVYATHRGARPEPKETAVCLGDDVPTPPAACFPHCEA